jgi:quercetin dioxygenase-like cupin family protein
VDRRRYDCWRACTIPMLKGTVSSMPPVRRPLAMLTIDGGTAVEHVQITEITLAPGAPVGRHLHPVPVVGYIVTGQILFEIDGGEPRLLSAGEAFYEPPAVTILHFDNASASESATFVAVYLLGSKAQDLIQMIDS